jgi:tyrosine-protein kinase Etk/Wzc
MHLEEVAVRKGDFLDFVVIALKWRRLVVAITIVTAVLATIVSLLLPVTYRATASVMPPLQTDLWGAMGSAGSVLKSLSGGKAMGGLRKQSGAYNYFAILKSRSASEAMVQHFGLKAVYEISDSSMEKTIKELESKVSFLEDVDESITIEVNDKDPQRAADMANYYVETLNQISMRLGKEEAGATRAYLQRRVEDTQLQLRLAEDSLQREQERAGIILTPDQSAGAIGVASLYSMKARKDVEVDILRRTLAPGDPQLVQAQMELGALERRLANIPEVGLKGFRLYRNALIQQKILEFLYPMFEQARIDEQKDLPVLLVLDPAIRPEKKDSPKRLIIIVSSAVSAFVLMLMWVAIVEAINQFKARNPDRVQQFRTVFFSRREDKA